MVISCYFSENMKNEILMNSDCSFNIGNLSCTFSSLIVGSGVALATFLLAVVLLFSCGYFLHWVRSAARPYLHRSQRVDTGLVTLGQAPPPTYDQAMSMGMVPLGNLTEAVNLSEDFPPPYSESWDPRTMMVRGRRDEDFVQKCWMTHSGKKTQV